MALLFVGLLAAGVARAGDPGAEYARQVSTAQVRLAQLEALLVEAELRIEQLEEVIRQRGQSEQSRLENLDQVVDEVTRLRGSIEVLQFETGELKRAVADQQLDGERRQLHAEMRLAQVEKFLAIQPPAPPSDADLGLTERVPHAGSGASRPPQLPARDEPIPENVPADAKGKLDAAIAHMEADRQGVARAVLRAAIEHHAGAPEMDEVRYRFAETYLNEGEYRAAISEFNKVVNNHPDSPWKCWAFYRMGEAFESMGQVDGAAAFYKGATERECKNSDAAKKAKDKL